HHRRPTPHIGDRRTTGRPRTHRSLNRETQCPSLTLCPRAPGEPKSTTTRKRRHRWRTRQTRILPARRRPPRTGLVVASLHPIGTTSRPPEAVPPALRESSAIPQEATHGCLACCPNPPPAAAPDQPTPPQPGPSVRRVDRRRRPRHPH